MWLSCMCADITSNSKIIIIPVIIKHKILRSTKNSFGTLPSQGFKKKKERRMPRMITARYPSSWLLFFSWNVIPWGEGNQTRCGKRRSYTSLRNSCYKCSNNLMCSVTVKRTVNWLNCKAGSDSAPSHRDQCQPQVLTWRRGDTCLFCFTGFGEDHKTVMVKTREPHKQRQKVQVAPPGQSPAVHCEREHCKYQGFTAAAGRNPRLLIQPPST